MAAKVQFEDDNGHVVLYVRHANGGGLVSPQVRVHEGSRVASTCLCRSQRAGGRGCRIGAGSWLDHDVVVGEDVVVAGNVHLGPRTRAEDGTWIGTGARVGPDVVIVLGARVAPDAVVRDSAVVRRRAGSGGSEIGNAALDRFVPSPRVLGQDPARARRVGPSAYGHPASGGRVFVVDDSPRSSPGA